MTEQQIIAQIRARLVAFKLEYTHKEHQLHSNLGTSEKVTLWNEYHDTLFLLQRADYLLREIEEKNLAQVETILEEEFWFYCPGKVYWWQFAIKQIATLHKQYIHYIKNWLAYIEVHKG